MRDMAATRSRRCRLDNDFASSSAAAAPVSLDKEVAAVVGLMSREFSFSCWTVGVRVGDGDDDTDA